MQSTMALSPLSQYWKAARTFAKKVYKINFYVLGSTILNIFFRSDIWILQVFPRVTPTAILLRGKTRTSVALISKQYSWDNLQNKPPVYFINQKAKVINNVQWVRVGLAQLSWIKETMPLRRYVINLKSPFSNSLRWDEIGCPVCQAKDKFSFCVSKYREIFQFGIKGGPWWVTRAAVMHPLPRTCGRHGKQTGCNTPFALHSQPHKHFL